MSWPYPRIIAHRGGGELAPENTLAAMRRGVALGFHAVEFDVKLAKDGVPFLLHDDTFDRTSDRKGPANLLTAGELAQVDAGSWYSPEFAGEPVARFDDVAKFLLAHDAWANVEIKPSPGFDAATGSAVALACRELWKDAERKPVLSSFSLAALRAAIASAPELPYGYLVDDVPPHWAATMRELKCISLHCNEKKLSRDVAAAVKGAGYGLLTWTVNDPNRARELFAWGVDAIFTDRLNVITPAFA
jgi:glycerophosphoryl diester phosphodiesterase